MRAFLVAAVVASSASAAHRASTLQKRAEAAARAREAVLQEQGESAPSLIQTEVLKAEPTPPPLFGNHPEALTNVLDYEITQPTPLPARLNGVYCRGSACMYRNTPLPPLALIPSTPPPAVVYGLSQREFCRGLSCIPFMGWPGNAALDGFKLRCNHLFTDVLGGLKGPDDHRTVVDVRDSFEDVCKKQVGPLEVGACPGYSEVLVSAVSASVEAETVGGVPDVCTNTFFYIAGVKQAEIDMKLNEAALPKSNSLLAMALNRFGTGGVGANSPRGKRWKAWAWQNHKPTSGSGVADSTNDASLVQKNKWTMDAWGTTQANAEEPEPAAVPAPAVPVREESHHVNVEYEENAGSPHVVKMAPQSNTKYIILPGSPDGVVPPVEIDGDLFNYCSNQMSEIMMGFAQTARMTVQMTKDWCSWQSSVTSWVGESEELGHPDWDVRRCGGMETLTAFALRSYLDTNVGLSSAQVCKNLFLSLGTVHRVDQIVNDAWTLSLRASPGLSLTTAPGNDEEMKALMAEATKFADALFSKLRGQKQAFDAANGAKMDVASWDAAPIAPNAPEPPSLPDLEDVDSSLIAVSTSHLRRWGK